MVKERKDKQRNHITNIPRDLNNIEGRGDKRKCMAHNYFVLNFNNDKKVVSISLKTSDGIFQLAESFSKWLTENDIPHEVTELPITETEQDESTNN